MKLKLKAAIGAAAVLLGTQAMAQITFYEREGFGGRAFSTDRRVGNFERFGFNDRASSVVVDRGRWEVCDEPRFEGHCVVLRRGSYDSLRGLGMQNAISSVRPVERDRDRDRQAAVNEMPPPLPAPSAEYRRRSNERILQVPVTSARAVVGPPDQRCWVERQQVGQAVPPNSGQNNVGGALLGGLIGGVLGHQVGGGSGRDLATVGGAVAGAVVGNNVGRNGNPLPSAQDVQRCENVQNPTPAYWDVTYDYRGQEHHVQMTTPPGSTIPINERGEPRM